MAYDGRLRNGHVDVFSGPSVCAAVEHARSVAPGQFEATAFSAWDGASLIGVEGRSLILRLPESASENNRPYVGERWYCDGTPTGDLCYRPRYVHDYVETTRCWLMDVAILRNHFAEDPDREAILFARMKSLDTGHFMSSGGQKLAAPQECGELSEHIVHFDVQLHGAVGTGEDIPIALWYAHKRGAKITERILDRVADAPFACVFFVRFQATDPHNAE